MHDEIGIDHNSRSLLNPDVVCEPDTILQAFMEFELMRLMVGRPRSGI